MKKIFAGLILLAGLYASPTLEIVGGAITTHYPFDFNMGSSASYRNKISSDGLIIFNPMIGAKLIQETNMIYFGACLYSGANSLGYPMVGAIGSVGFRVFKYRWLHLGLVAGGYTYFTPLGKTYFLPVGGIEANVKIPFGKKVFMKINTLVTPILINNSISFGINL